ncbi:polysaccharide deacetylase family protein [Geotalea sp. SG265]|uniref:polysaccharide deacetylase family protein n=1 Tax=Geotalea sp. SG265 TaxID=2922867 RepID=UPI001FAE955B|nr:polysaccharide deacetylase family protein [Geotalea sp. SG265]
MNARRFISRFFSLGACAAAFLLLPIDSPAGTITIADYKPIFHICRDASGTVSLAIRRFSRDGVAEFLLVNPQTLETSVLPAAVTSPASLSEAAEVEHSPFVTALARSNAQPRLQNAGLTHAESPQQGVFLTVDMCPSKRPFEREMFTAVADLSGKTGSAVPLAVAMTGKWLERHPEELLWLKNEVASGKLAITWVNHSYSHPYDPKKPVNINFLLIPGSDFIKEVLTAETAFLEQGLVPSPFFRFPGLVADGTLLKKLRQLSLIPLGSDAWLAKGEVPINGSIILVHGNGNEPQGIRRLLPLLRGENPPRLLPLAKAIGAGGRQEK